MSLHDLLLMIRESKSCVKSSPAHLKYYQWGKGLDSVVANPSENVTYKIRLHDLFFPMIHSEKRKSDLRIFKP